MSAPANASYNVPMSVPSADEWTTIWIASLPNSSDELHISLSAVLNRRYEVEAKAMDLFSPAGGRIELQYKVRVNLDVARGELSKLIQAIYKSDLRSPQLLCSDPLKLVPDEKLREMFAPIAVVGESVFRRLFGGRPHFEGYLPGDNAMLQEVVRSVLTRPNNLIIKSPVRLFPWTFLYDETFDPNNQSSFSTKRFWGFKHLIGEEIDGIARRAPIRRPARLIAAVCPQTDKGEEHARGPLGLHATQRDISVEWVKSTAELRRALSNFDADCLYFYGHAHQDNPPLQTTSWLKLDGLNLTANEISQAEPKFEKNPVVVFLNGCETAPLHLWNNDSVAGLLWEEGKMRLCCVTTFAPVPASFGRAFGLAFWNDFIEGRTLGRALLDARIQLFEKYSNPLGLLYTLFGKTGTQFI